MTEMIKEGGGGKITLDSMDAISLAPLVLSQTLTPNEGIVNL
jgi:hypothetical protein